MSNDLTREQLNLIYSLEDSMKGNIVRCCISDDYSEVKKNYEFAIHRIMDIGLICFQRFDEFNS